MEPAKEAKDPRVDAILADQKAIRDTMVTKEDMNSKFDHVSGLINQLLQRQGPAYMPAYPFPGAAAGSPFQFAPAAPYPNPYAGVPSP